MIDPKATVTYAQYNEDVILQALLHDVKKGFYVDVGANYPTVDSVTKSFYDQGWHGINIEPIRGLHQQLLKERPRDVNLQCGAGDKSGTATLREYTDVSGHSTFSTEQKEQHEKTLKHTDYEVDIRTLKNIFTEYDVKHIHFLKIDVEGFEYEVVAGNDWKAFRPEVLCIEANHRSRDWQKILKDNKYDLFISDGLNEYYVAHEVRQRTRNFAERIIAIDYHALKQHQWQSWSHDSETLQALNKTVAAYGKRIKEMDSRNRELESLATLSLKNRPLGSRVKRALYGLTVDWIRYKRAGPKDL